MASVWLIDTTLSCGTAPRDTTEDIEYFHPELGQFGLQLLHETHNRGTICVAQQMILTLNVILPNVVP